MSINVSVNTITPLFSDEDRVRNVVRTFRHILGQIIDQPELGIQQLDLVSNEEKILLGVWNAPISSQPTSCVHTAILKNCLKSPHKPAVNAWDGDLSYGELNELSARVAHYLCSLNLTPDTIIPLCFEKSKWAIVTVLAVLRAGAAYVFLDSNSPPARMKSVCDDVKADFIICSETCLSTASQLVPRAIAVQMVAMDTAMSTNAGPKDDLVAVTDPIYAVFTSGSTGRPKGVVIEHGGFFQRAMANGPSLRLSDESRVLQFANFAFDAANRDILYTLLYGGCICIPSGSQRSNDLTAFINQQRVNWVSITPSAGRILDPEQVPTIRTMNSCGEPMSSGLVSKWADRVHLINAYGPSEATTISSMTIVTKSTSPMNIGKGSGSVLWIVDSEDHNRLAPIGAVGELLIESPSVGRGYLNRPSNTASAFLPRTDWISEFRAVFGSGRLYKTGDLAQYAADGTIMFSGRKDGQIKINGQRVDVGEIEHWIHRSLPYDTDVIIVVDLVMPKGRDAGVLVAFCAPENGQADTDNLQETIERLSHDLDVALSEYLPSYMIPRFYLPVQTIPTTATGKIHRQQLRQLGATYTIEDLIQSSRHSGQCSNGFNHELESPEASVLLQLWALVLRIDESSIQGRDSFLHLGGDSVMAIQMAVEARSKGLDLSVADLLEKNTLDNLISIVTSRARISQTPMDPELFSLCSTSTVTTVRNKLAHLDAQNGILDILPTTAAQNFFLTQWSLSCYRCELNGLVDLSRLQAACTAVVCRHSILRTVFIQIPDDEFVQVVLKTTDPTLEYRQIANENFNNICPPLAAELITEMSPTAGRPLVRFILLSKSDTEHALLVRVCHAQYDGNTSPIIFRDISSAYNACSDDNGDESLLPAAAPFQHYLYARKERQNSPNDDPAIKFWRQNLQGAHMTTFTPLSSTNPNNEPMTPVVTEAIGVPLPRVVDHITLPTLINTACSLLLADVLGLDDLVFGNVMDTRGAGAFPGIETTLGPCLNINPLRVRLDARETTTFLDLCHSLSEQTMHVARYAATWDLSDIMAHCTDWPVETQMGCILNHTRPKTGPLPLTLDGVTCLSIEKTVENDMARQVLFECNAGRERLEIQVVTSSAVMDLVSATRLAERLVAAISTLSEAPGTLLADVRI
ncbi:unnamed protein product [Penicillium salamii]|nr:unnamed protein product [Penicillium salamii]CAG8389495.1 unnamed protein product [Penicillium salamii]